jgi:PAS domain S-box-containing protein
MRYLQRTAASLQKDVLTRLISDELVSYRFLMFLACVTFISSSQLVKMEYPFLYDPAEVRIGVSAVMLGIFGLTFISPFVKKYVLKFLLVIFFLASTHLILVLYSNNFTLFVVLGFSNLLLFSSLFFKKSAHLVIFIGVMMAILLGACIFSNLPYQAWILLFLNIFTLAFISISFLLMRLYNRNQLLIRNDLLVATFSQSHDALVLIDDSTRKIINCNEKAVTLFNLNGQREFINSTADRMFDNHFSVQDKRNLSIIMSQQDDYTCEYLLKTSHNKEFWANLSISKIRTGAKYNWLLRFIDITDSKYFEEEQERLTKELTYSNSELQKFAYITSHNLRAPVINLVSLLNIYNKENLDDAINPVVIDKVEKSINILNATLNDLIEVVTIRDRQDTRETINFREILDSVKASIESQLVGAGARISADFTAAQEMVYIRNQIHNILLNLFTNSVKYRSPDRELMITVKTERIDSYVRLSVSDNGIGIDMEKNKNKIFGLYQRFCTEIEGKGLGLYIIKSQVQASGGKIEVESDYGHGTTFRLYFPLT